MKFRPCIDLHNGIVKQIVGSSLSDGGTIGLITNFETDLSPAYFARMYKADGLSGGHVVMLGPGNEKAATSALSAFPEGLHIGGGITPDNAQAFLNAGASHVIVTSFVFKNGIINWHNLEAMEKSIGRQRLVLDLSCKKINDRYFIATDKWQKVTSTSIESATLEQLGKHCNEFLVHAVDVEGKQQGIDAPLVGLLAVVSPLPITYAGGIRSLADLEDVYITGKGRVDATVGSALDIFGGPLKYADVVAWQKNVSDK
jgi:phosphoribosylformimino-5-aminoimidazole carboxamide ribotide isomerase, eukaryotic type